MQVDYPLRFEPIVRRALWGGRRLETHLGKPLPAGNDWAESWEVVDHGSDQSVVKYGPLQGATLSQLMRAAAPDLLGPYHERDRFPLLVKFLDVRESISVQVHPNDEQAAQLHPPDGGKTEAWYVLDAAPGSRIYAGLSRGVDRLALQQASARGQTEACLSWFEPAVGDCVLVPAGTVHALGAGLLVAEIQQSSDTTFRLFDWNRLGPDGQPRPLHVSQALDTIDYQAGPVRPVSARPQSDSHPQRLITHDKFLVDRWSGATRHPVGGDQRCHILVMISGRVELERDAAAGTLRAGQVVLIPAAAGPLMVTPEGPAVMLDAYLPSEPA